MQKIEYIEIDRLKPHPENPRKMDDRQMDILCDSLKKNPDYFETRPILCNKDMVVFAGNMRMLAAKKIGLTKVPVCIMDIPEERQREIMIRDNRSNGTWDYDVLANQFEVAELSAWGFNDRELTGFDAPPAEPSGADGSPACERCAELKKAVEGHQKRSGHKLIFDAPVDK